LDEQLLALCWSRDDDGVGVGPYLLRLAREEETRAFLAACEEVGNGSILERIARARYAIEDEEDVAVDGPRIASAQDPFRLAELIEQIEAQEE
jgi:hypothetical protein